MSKTNKQTMMGTLRDLFDSFVCTLSKYTVYSFGIAIDSIIIYCLWV